MSAPRSEEARPGGAEERTTPLISGGAEEREEHEQTSSVLCDSLHSSIHLTENSAMMRAVLCAQVCKVYRFQSEDGRWLLVREQMSETPLSFSLPRQLLNALAHEHRRRVQELTELGDLSPHLDALRRDVTQHCEHLRGGYLETLEELNTLPGQELTHTHTHTLTHTHSLRAPPGSWCFKSSGSRAQRHLQFVPTNLHSQRMEVTGPHGPGVWYDVITFGAPADHHQAFKHGGLRRLMSHREHAHCASYSLEEVIRAQEVLHSVARLQPQIFGNSEELLAVSLQEDAVRLQEALDALSQQTERFVHALKDELVKSALLDAHRTGPAPPDPLHINGGRQDEEYDEEEWDRAWVNVTKSLNCIVVLVDRLQGREDRPPLMTSSEPQEPRADRTVHNTACSSWQEQLLPLVVTLRDCVREAMAKARVAMTFVVLQEAVAATLAQGPAPVVMRRHAVFSQALAALVCGFTLKLYGGLDDPHFLHQLHSVGVLAQFEGLLSTYGDEVGMLEDMDVGVADLSNVAFRITESRTDEDLLPRLSGNWGAYVVEVPLPSENFGVLPPELRHGGLIRVEGVLFNIGINQQQSLAERFGHSSLQETVNQQSGRRLQSYCDAVRALHTDVQSLPDLLSSLHRSIQSRKRKNVEVLWIAATICRAVNGVRLTSCKSAKDRTAMSVTLEQCALLRERHALGQRHFGAALDLMRRSRLSWGEMLGCFSQSGWTVSGPPPSDVRGSALLKAPRRHLYPVAFLLVTSHLLVLWLILSLVILLDKYQ